MMPNPCLSVPAAAAAAQLDSGLRDTAPEAAPLPVAGWLARFNMSAGGFTVQGLWDCGGDICGGVLVWAPLLPLLGTLLCTWGALV